MTNGFKQSKLEIVVDLDRFIMTDGNVPLPQLPKTGDGTNRPLQLAVAALAMGAALVLVRRRLRLN
ncbi:MAG: LPXTG cell wall anchor domain-containing protein [Acidimicrobiia bacterium]|nr:LPXTG cell wall anchor domain-containing protein [Acidimicrobiia bacterium]